MPKEIERKFLVKTIPLNETVISRQHISQNYLATGDEEVRLRYKVVEGVDPDLTISIKRGSGIEREEITNVITQATFEQMSANYQQKPITKIRSLISYGEYLLEIDAYEDIDLIVGEVEFESLQQATSFIPPDWFGEEVTDDASYKNQNLWKHLQSH